MRISGLHARQLLEERRLRDVRDGVRDRQGWKRWPDDQDSVDLDGGLPTGSRWAFRPGRRASTPTQQQNIEAVAPLAGAQPPHSTAVSSKTWYGSQSAATNLGQNPPRSKVSAAHAYVSGSGQGAHLHHEVGSDGSVGDANLQAVTQHLENVKAGRTPVPPAHQQAVITHLQRHLLDHGARVPPNKPVSGDETNSRTVR